MKKMNGDSRPLLANKIMLKNRGKLKVRLVCSTIAILLAIISTFYVYYSMTPESVYYQFSHYFGKHGKTPPKKTGFLMVDYPIIMTSSSESDELKNDPLLSSTKTILLWTSAFGSPDWKLGAFGREPLKRLKCPVSNCWLTNDRNYLAEADAVLVHFRDDFNYNDRPQQYYRKANQRWIFVIFESPDHTYSWVWQLSRQQRRLTNFSNFFNWTMTYRLDSDIPLQFGRFTKLSEPDFSRIGFDRLANKTKSAVWMNSHCDTPSRRENYASALAKYIDIDTIGSCGSNLANLTSGLCNRPSHSIGTSHDCLEHLSQTYKFYLSFENSLCRDYVTEKFYRAAKLDLIPVVFNGADMSLFAPPHSYIDAQQFSSPADLAKFLKKVGSDPVLYNSYFWWKPFYDVENLWDKTAWTKHFCDLCAKVNLASSFERKSYEDIDRWWTTDGRCHDGQSRLFESLTKKPKQII